jgi:hypothetical protein
MKKLSMMDKGFLFQESREMPMHVGSLNLYTLPDGVDEQEFLHGLARNTRDADVLLPPFGDRLKLGRMGLAGNAYWEPDPNMDMDYHVRHSALPKPGRYRELFNLVSRLHSTLLERSRPLWETHLIEGLQNRQFAVCPCSPGSATRKRCARAKNPNTPMRSYAMLPTCSSLPSTVAPTSSPL